MQVVPKDKLTVKPVPTTPDESAIALAENQQKLEAQRQQQLAAQRQQQLEAQHQQQLAAQRQQQLAAQRQQELAAQRQQENPGNTNSPPSPDAVGGSLIASLVGEPQQEQRDRHTHPANIKTSNQPFSKGLEYTKFIEQKPGQPVELTVILTISEKGKLEKVAIAQPVDSAIWYYPYSFGRTRKK